MNADTIQPKPPLMERAAQLLITPSALGQLSMDEARQVVNYMKPCAIPAGKTIMREGDAVDNDFMLLVLEGDVEIDSHELHADGRNMVVRVMGKGSLVGELGLLDGLARSVSCVARTDIQAVMLYRQDFARLLEAEPRLGARLLLAISTRTAAKLRQITDKLKLLFRINAALKERLVADATAVFAADLSPAPAPAKGARPADPAAANPTPPDVDWPDAP